MGIGILIAHFFGGAPLAIGLAWRFGTVHGGMAADDSAGH